MTTGARAGVRPADFVVLAGAGCALAFGDFVQVVLAAVIATAIGVRVTLRIAVRTNRLPMSRDFHSCLTPIRAPAAGTDRSAGRRPGIRLEHEGYRRQPGRRHDVPAPQTVADLVVTAVDAREHSGRSFGDISRKS